MSSQEPLSSTRKTFHKPVTPNSKKPASSFGIKSMFRAWLDIPPRIRLYVGGSTLLVVILSDKYLKYSEEGFAAENKA